MKLLSFMLVAGFLVAGFTAAQLCNKLCPKNNDPHCACKGTTYDTCKEFNSKCFFEQTNCTSKDFTLLMKGACPKKEKFDIIAKCYRPCNYQQYEPRCACTALSYNRCEEHLNQCISDMCNCTTPDFVYTMKERCPRCTGEMDPGVCRVPS